jgi:hypothetical protein
VETERAFRDIELQQEIPDRDLQLPDEVNGTNREQVELFRRQIALLSEA